MTQVIKRIKNAALRRDRRKVITGFTLQTLQVKRQAVKIIEHQLTGFSIQTRHQ